MLTLLPTLAVAQADVTIVHPGESFRNDSTATMFVLPRYRLERLLVQAVLSDSMGAMWKLDAQARSDELAQVEAARSFWRSGAFAVLIVAAVEFLVLVIR